MTRGLDHPPLGLVLMMGAAYALPAYASLAVTSTHLHAWGDRFGIVLILELATIALQLAAGAAIAWRRFARPVFAVYAGVACAVVVVGAYAMHDGIASAVALACETLAFPAMVIVAPRALRLDALAGSRGRAEISAVLLVLGVSGLLGTALATMDQVHELAGWHASIGGYLGLATQAAITIAIAVLALFAGARTTRRRFLAYVIIRIVLHAVFLTVALVSLLAIERLGEGMGYVVVLQAVGFLTSLVTPLVLWAYVRDRFEDVRPASPQVLAWCMLGLAPIAFGRVAFVGTLGTTAGTGPSVVAAVLCGLLALALFGSAVATLRGRPKARALAIVAAAITCTLVVLVMVAVFVADPERFATRPYGTIALLVALPAVTAWLTGRAGSPDRSAS